MCIVENLNKIQTITFTCELESLRQELSLNLVDWLIEYTSKHSFLNSDQTGQPDPGYKASGSNPVQSNSLYCPARTKYFIPDSIILSIMGLSDKVIKKNTRSNESINSSNHYTFNYQRRCVIDYHSEIKEKKCQIIRREISNHNLIYINTQQQPSSY